MQWLGCRGVLGLLTLVVLLPLLDRVFLSPPHIMSLWTNVHAVPQTPACPHGCRQFQNDVMYLISFG